MKFFTCTLLALAGLAALSTAAPHSDKKEQIKELCQSGGSVKFDRHEIDDIMVEVSQVCDAGKEGHLKPGLHLKDGHIEGPIHYKKGDKYGEIVRFGN
ncbi:hypothetical protein LTR17_025208 [Elasticomyces elasticus]|nr:hypothetical protein LTR17_025208 [Elasticomyces elasticus]